MSSYQVRTSPNRRMAGHVICNFAQSVLYIFNGDVSDFSILVRDLAFRRRGSLIPYGCIKRNYGLQSFANQIDYFYIQCSVSFFVTTLNHKYDSQNKYIGLYSLDSKL